MATVLASGPGAVMSHRAAGSLQGVRASEVLEVTVGRGSRGRPGIRVHRLPLPHDEITTERGIPVTSISRTLFDLAALLPRDRVERAINEAEYQRRRDRLSLPQLVERYPRRKGVATIKAILADRARASGITRSELEHLFLSFLTARGFPAPEVNVPIVIAGRWFECDCVWRDRQVIVELDGLAAHGTAAAFERDRARDRTLHAAGWRIARITWRQLQDEPDAVAYDLSAILSAGSSSAPSRSTVHSPALS
jgi:very-short-patch-repair endonuclease